MMKKQSAFTLIELMVVVAIIAILATLSVSNFSTAIRRTRNTQRVSDIQAVSKGMETCYDAMKATYPDDAGTNGTEFGGWKEVTTTAAGPFSIGANKCLNADILPGVANYSYSYLRTAQGGAGTSSTYAVCAKLEFVEGWESVGNTKGAITAPELTYDNSNHTWKFVACTVDEADGCNFCSVNQQ